MLSKQPQDNNPLPTMLEYLSTQLDNFEAIREFIVGNGVSSSSLFLGQTLSLVDGEISRNPTFLYQCTELLDIMSVFSISVYGSPETYVCSLIEGVLENRLVADFELTLASSVTTHLYYKDRSEFEKFIKSNKYLMALYIYAVLMTILFKE